MRMCILLTVLFFILSGCIPAQQLLTAPKPVVEETKIKGNQSGIIKTEFPKMRKADYTYAEKNISHGRRREHT